MDEASIARWEKRWPKYWTLAVLILLILLAGFYFYDYVYFVPPIPVTVVDAITGKAVPGMNACLQVDSGGMGPHEVLRKELSRSNTQGEVSFSRSIHRITLLRPWEGYSIRVTDPRTDYATPCGPDLGPELNEAFPNQRRANQDWRLELFPCRTGEARNAHVQQICLE